MEPNKVFYNFLEKKAPYLAKKFRKTDYGYCTYPALKKIGEMFSFNVKTNVITKTYLQTVYVGGAYEKELAYQQYQIV